MVPTDAERTEALRTQIRGAGLRSTMSRVLVLQRVMDASTPVSHADLAEALVPSGLDRATIYRNLIDLTEAGLLARTDHGDHVWRFAYREANAGGHDEHVHFVCTACGVVSCVHDVDTAMIAAAAGRPMPGRVTEIVIRGQCVACV